MNAEQLAWDMYFANLVAMQFHPRNVITSVDETLKDCEHLANKMMEIRRKNTCQHG